MGPVGDPLGLLERVPELQSVASHDAGVRKAIERGRAHRLYYRLLRLRWFGGGGVDRATLDALLVRRRLFIEPLRGAPALFTFNGCGLTVYGSNDVDAQDGTYVKTLFIVLVFVPLYPLGSYLVQSGTKSKSWLFIGRLPLGLATYLWQRLTALAVLCAALLGAGRALDSALHNSVYVANALPQPIVAHVGSKTLDVPAASTASVRTSVGRQPVEILLAGKKLESGSIDVKRGASVVAWNVLGLGAVYQVRVAWVADGATPPPDPVPQLFCGQNEIVLDKVDYPFVKPPARMDMPDGSKAVWRTATGFVSGPELCLGYLVQHGATAHAADLAARYSKADGYSAETVRAATQLLAQFRTPQAAVDLARHAVRVHDTSVEHHRIYQDMLEIAGLRSQGIAEYRKRYLEHPNSGDAAYLYARLLHGKEEAQVLESAVAKFPDHPYLLRSLAYSAFEAGDDARTVETLEHVRRLDPALWAQALELEAAALAAQNDIPRARALVAERLKAADLDEDARFEAVRTALELTRFEPHTDPLKILAELDKDGKSGAAVRRLRARLESGLPVDAWQLGAVGSKRAMSVAYRTALLARGDPRAALKQAATLPKDAAAFLPPAIWGLLTGEAVRTESSSLAKLLDACPMGVVYGKRMADYLRNGSNAEEVDSYGGALAAALHFERSRQKGVSTEDASALVARARHEDALRGPVTLAMDAWK